MTKKTNSVKRPYPRVQITITGPSKTDESFAPGCNVNSIVRRFAVGTESDPWIARKAQEKFGDATGPSYEEAMRQTAAVNSAFLDLSASERAQHQNDPARWLDTLDTINVELDDSPEASEPPPLEEPPTQEVTTE